jgi:hypothetical protein
VYIYIQTMDRWIVSSPDAHPDHQPRHVPRLSGASLLHWSQLRNGVPVQLLVSLQQLELGASSDRLWLALNCSD